jgi:hypothetical protein
VTAEGPREEPEFLSAPGAAPSAEDMAMFDQMMGAVLAPQSGEAAPVAPAAESVEAAAPPSSAPVPLADEYETPVVPVAPVPYVEEQEPIDAMAGFGALTTADHEDIPAPPKAEAYRAPEGFVPTGDFETDLRTLGLGELPPELTQPQPELAPEPVAFEPASETEGDLDELIRSLDATGVESPSGVISSGTDYGAEDVTGAGVISTDEYLSDFDSDMGLSSGLGDELTALTGGGTGRARPVPTVAKIPEPGEGVVLHRDQMVDRSLIEKIIEGIENL